jgi:ubiquinone/menaquinone biosynthesis C-methylase UbiE
VVRDGERTAAQYDAMAAAYDADTAHNAFNASYERPATIELLGDVRHRQVLEVGCGAGPLTTWLVDHGAHVTAMDVSPEMVRLAAARVGGRARLVVGDLERPLDDVADGSVDVVVASLVLHYVRHWLPVLAEFRRVLVPGGVVVFSTHHPAMDWQLHSPDDYFAVKQVTETWTKGGRPFAVTFWRRPLTAMTEAVAAAGFVIERLIEPQPTADAAADDPEADHWLRTRPQFLFFRLRAL